MSSSLVLATVIYVQISTESIRDNKVFFTFVVEVVADDLIIGPFSVGACAIWLFRLGRSVNSAICARIEIVPETLI